MKSQFTQLLLDREALHAVERRDVRDMHALDVVGNRTFLGNLVDEALDFSRFSADFHLHGTISQIPYGPDDLKPFG